MPSRRLPGSLALNTATREGPLKLKLRGSAEAVRVRRSYEIRQVHSPDSRIRETLSLDRHLLSSVDGPKVLRAADLISVHNGRHSDPAPLGTVAPLPLLHK